MFKIKKFFKFLSLVLSLVCFCRCAGLHSVTALPSASLDRGNFKYIRYVEAEETAIYVFGIGGMSQKSRNTNAYNQMVAKAQLQPNQAITNVSIRKNRHFYFPMGAIVSSVTTTVSGIVVEFTDGKATPPTKDTSTQNNTTLIYDSKAVQSATTNNNVTKEGIYYILTLLVKDEDSISISASEYESKSSLEGKVKLALSIIDPQVSSNNPANKYARTNLSSLKAFLGFIRCDYGSKRIIVLEQKLNELCL